MYTSATINRFYPLYNALNGHSKKISIVRCRRNGRRRPPLASPRRTLSGDSPSIAVADHRRGVSCVLATRACTCGRAARWSRRTRRPACTADGRRAARRPAGRAVRPRSCGRAAPPPPPTPSRGAATRRRRWRRRRGARHPPAAGPSCSSQQPALQHSRRLSRTWNYLFKSGFASSTYVKIN